MDSIQLFGPFCSGTNLLTKILESNVNEKYNIHNQGHTHIWKHTVRYKHLDNCVNTHKNTLFICLYKPLYHWIESMKKASYDIKWNKDITTPCDFRSSGRHWKNIIEIYNTYYLNYSKLIEKYNNVICINYYKLLDINTVTQYINNKLKPFNLQLNSNNSIAIILNKPSKTHGKSVKHAGEALTKKIKLEKQLENTDEKQLMDSMVDNSIVPFFNKQ